MRTTFKIAVGAAAILAAFGASAQAYPVKDKNITIVKKPGEPDMEIVVRENGKEIRYKGNGGSSDGRGVRAGIAYKLKDGNIIYVPEGSQP